MSLPGARRDGPAGPHQRVRRAATLAVGEGRTWRGYGAVGCAEQLVAGYADLVTALLDSPAVVGFCWTQLTDTQQERNGLLTADRVPR